MASQRYSYNNYGEDININEELDVAGATWTLAELTYLRDNWRKMSLTELSRKLQRSEKALIQKHQKEMKRPEALRFTPSNRKRDAYGHHLGRSEPQLPPQRHAPDEDAWWEPDHYKKGAQRE